MRRTNCSACGSDSLQVFLDLGSSPVADAYTESAAEVSASYPLDVARCAECGLAQLLEALDGKILFGTGYSFYSSASPPLSKYHAQYAEQVIRLGEAQLERGVVEIGCNDGDLLRHFADYPHLGVDPAEGPTEMATRRGLRIRNEPFGAALAQEVREELGPQGLVIANHVLAHVEDVADVLAGIAHLMDDESVAMIEVQYLPDLLVNNAFDLVYHEHRNFFSLTSLMEAARRHGLYIYRADLTDRQGGSLRVSLRRGLTRTTLGAIARILQAEKWLKDITAFTGLQGRAERIRARLLDILHSERGPVAVYGAPAKATTLLNFCGLDVSDLAWCVDSTPAKQGRFIPGTGIPIVAPGSSPEPNLYLLTAHNYAGVIMANNPGNRWLLPIPAPMVL